MGVILHHIKKRKQKIHHSLNLRQKELLDKTVLTLAALWPLANLPQALQVHVQQEVAGLNIISWTAYVLFTIPWIIYGFLHKDKLIQFAYIANLLLYLSIVIGILIY